MNLPSVTFANPGLWVGLLALGVPLLVHLLTRRSRRPFVFPSLRFLSRAHASQSRLFRLRHRVLYALRTLLLLAVVLAFVKPLLRGAGAAKPGAEREPAAVAIVLDGSASMGYQGLGSTVFTRGKVAALNLLDGLGASDCANVIIAAAAPRVSLKEPSPHRHHLRLDLEKSSPSPERADLAAAVAEAVRQLAGARQARRELHVISDFQRSNWADADLARIPRDVRTTLVPVGEADAVNAAVTEVLLNPPFPVVNEEVEITWRVLNAAAEDAELPVELQLDGETVARRDLRVPARMTATASYRFRPPREGVLEGAVRLPADRLPADDVRYFTVTVSDRVAVLLVSDEPESPGAGARALAAAICPFATREGSPFAVTRVASAAAGTPSPGRHHIVVLGAARPLSDRGVDALLAYAKGGGALLVCLAGPDDAGNLARLAERSHGDLVLPFLPIAPRAEAVHLAEANFDHPVFARFRDVPSLSEINFTHHFATERARGKGQVLARFDDGSVAIALQSVGAGTLAVCNFWPATRQADLAKRALFVPLVHELCKGIRPRRGDTASFLVGQPCASVACGWDRDKPLRFVAPSGEETTGLFDVRQEETTVLLPETHETGFYRMYSGDRRIGAVAVNPDPRESDLAALSAEQVAGMSRRAGTRVIEGGDAGAEAVADWREGRPLWPFFLLAGFVLVAAEQGLWLLWKQ